MPAGELVSRGWPVRPAIQAGAEHAAEPQRLAPRRSRQLVAVPPDAQLVRSAGVQRLDRWYESETVPKRLSRHCASGVGRNNVPDEGPASQASRSHRREVDLPAAEAVHGEVGSRGGCGARPPRVGSASPRRGADSSAVFVVAREDVEASDAVGEGCRTKTAPAAPRGRQAGGEGAATIREGEGDEEPSTAQAGSAVDPVIVGSRSDRGPKSSLLPRPSWMKSQPLWAGRGREAARRPPRGRRGGWRVSAFAENAWC